MDFTIKIYQKLLESLQHAGFFFQTFAEYVSSLSTFNAASSLNANNSPLTVHHSPLIILRHDVDAKPRNALRFAKIQAGYGIHGTYYFRIVPRSFNERMIGAIAEMGHEIGYHYETMDTCKGNVDKAYDEFCRNLEKFQKLVPIKTISMHGSPMSSFDNREIWKKYDYKQLGIIAEPYFDINFNQLYYITDTGRRWDGHLFNVRDKATRDNPVTNPQFLKLRFHSTKDIIAAIERRAAIEKPITMDTDNGSPLQKNKNPEQRTKNTPFDPARAGIRARMPEHITLNNKHGTPNNNQIFPNQAMLNFHPQRWNDKPLPWLKELVWQNVKNQGKRILIKFR